MDDFETRLQAAKPSHYKGKNGFEVFDVLDSFLTVEQVKGFQFGNVIKYVLRHEQKNGVEDLVKAQIYLNLMIEEYAK